MKHKVLDHCIECNQLKRKIEEMANTIRFETKRANSEKQRANLVTLDLDWLKLKIEGGEI